MKKNLLFSLMSIFLLFTPMLHASANMVDTTTVVLGCMNHHAKNFNPLATKDNGSCIFGDSMTTAVVYGCMNPKAKNFNPKATRENGSCIFDSANVVYGCMDPTALNFNPFAKMGNHNCIYKTMIPGCMDSLALNFNPKANVKDGSCRFDATVWGCTDKTARNFNPRANHDNGYCHFDSIVAGCTDKMAVNFNPLANRDNRTCVYTEGTKLGCTDKFALNFNRFANTDNGSCVYELVSDTIKGCTDKRALNFNPTATRPNGKCIYTGTDILGCRSPKALNYDSLATRGDGSCIFARPVNIILPGHKPDITAIVDTLGKVLAASCNFDYTLTIDSARISGVKKLADNKVEVAWTIYQGSTITTIKTDFTFKKRGNMLLYLSLVCNQGVDSTATTVPSGVSSSKLFKSNAFAGSVATDVVKGVTFSAYLSNNVVSEVSNTMTNDAGVSLYPNPVRDQLNVSVMSTGNNTLQLIVYSADGHKLSTTSVTSNDGTNRYTINTTGLGSGLHFLTVNQNGKMLQTLKFSKN